MAEVNTTVVQDVSADSSPAKPAVIDLDSPLPAGTKAETAERFQRLLDDRKTIKQRVEAYEALGSPEEITALKTKAGEIDTLQAQIASLDAERRASGEAKSPDQKTAETNLAMARRELRQLDSGIERGEKAAEYVEAQIESVHADALEYTVEVLKAHGLAIDQATVAKWARRFSAEINGDARLQRMYFRNPEKAIDRVSASLFEEYGAVASRKADADKQRDKEKLGLHPKPHGGPGGTHTQDPPAPAKTVAEGITRFRNALRAQNTRGG